MGREKGRRAMKDSEGKQLIAKDVQFMVVLGYRAVFDRGSLYRDD